MIPQQNIPPLERIYQVFEVEDGMGIEEIDLD